ncbi:MAG TPA: rhomboid family intramembrane serine protease [Ktedonobacteraceae bacterium]|nr:rhomboid family intramembrane serine protease [Ktedonobacteraceae bacterium]
MSKASQSEHTNDSQPTLAVALDSQRERRHRIIFSYQFALGHHRKLRLADWPWATWLITLITCEIWCVTAYQVACQEGAQSWQAVLGSMFALDEDADVLVTFGAKYTPDIVAGQYWRLLTPIFLHANLLHLGLNMLNFLLLGLIIEHIFGHLRFVLLYLLTGVISILASLVFASQEVSVGASGAIFGLVGAYSVFILLHREAFRYHGILTIGWLILIIGINIGLGFVIPGIDNYAHLGGLLSGCLLGWLFAPFYTDSPAAHTSNGLPAPADVHSLKRRWPLVLLFIVLTVLSAIIAIHFVGG